VGALVCAVIMLMGLPEGPGQLFQIAAEHDKFSLGSFGLDLAKSTVLITLEYGLVINMQNFGIDQNYIQRYFAAKSDAEARKSIWLGGLLYIPVSATFFFIGTALFAYYQVNPDSLPVAYQSADTADRIFPYFIVSVLPTGITGLLIAAVFAAAMSTVSTSLNSSATIILNDYYQRLINRSATEKQSMRVLHGTTVVWGALGTLIAIAMTGARSALDAWWTLAGIFGGGTLGLFLLGFISRKPGSKAAAWAVAAGVMVILWMTLSPRMTAFPAGLKSPFHSFLIIVFGTATILGAGFLLTALIFNKKPKTTDHE